jgi:colicin import membrane protein
MQETRADHLESLGLALLLHVALFSVFWLAMRIGPVQEPGGSGEPAIQGDLQIAASDARRIEEMLAEAAREAAAALPAQRPPEPAPQDSPDPYQPTPQAPQEHEGPEDREAISEVGLQPEPVAAPEQQEQRRVNQIDLTADIERQNAAERRQRQMEQLAELRRQREQAAREAENVELPPPPRRDNRMGIPQAAPATAAQSTAAAPATGNAGSGGDPLDDLRSRYIAAIRRATYQYWDTARLPTTVHRVRCQVMVTQAPGGEVINLGFINCPYDERVKDTLRAAFARENRLPYAGFERVFMRQLPLMMCYPPSDQECEQ